METNTMKQSALSLSPANAKGSSARSKPGKRVGKGSTPSYCCCLSCSSSSLALALVSLVVCVVLVTHWQLSAAIMASIGSGAGQLSPDAQANFWEPGGGGDNNNNGFSPTLKNAWSVSQQQQQQQIVNRGDLYHRAWYMTEPDARFEQKAHTQIYEDERIRSLRRNASYVPWYMPIVNNTPYIQGTTTALSKRNGNYTGAHPILTGLRHVHDTRKFFNGLCARYRFPDLSVFPTVSIIMPMQNERPGMLTLTVHSLLARTPPSILKEIIVVDDNGGTAVEREGVDEEELAKLQELHPKVIYIRNYVKQGCAGARLEGIRRATADVIMVLDSHVEMYSSTWAQHLLLPLLENPRTMSMQTLDIVDDLPGHKRANAGGAQHFGFVDENFMFTYVADRFGEESASTREPFSTPFAPGSLFAMYRSEFWRLGGYDEGLAVWGGENTELVMKVWRCGFDNPALPPGRVVVVPCSRVGHVYRRNIKQTGRWPPPLPDYIINRYNLSHPGKWQVRGGRSDNFTKLVTRNNMRIMRVWMGRDSDATRNYYRRTFGVNSTNPKDLPPEWRQFEIGMDTDKDIAKQIAIRDANKCKDFDWFDRHILYKQVGRHSPYHHSTQNVVSCGRHKAKTCGGCPQTHGEVWCNGECHWCSNGSIKETNFSWIATAVSQGSQDLVWRLTEESMCVPRRNACRQQAPPTPPGIREKSASQNKRAAQRQNKQPDPRLRALRN